MNTQSARQAAVSVGSTVPRLLRAARDLGIDTRGASGARHKRRYSTTQVQALAAHLGKPVHPPLPGLSASEARVLAALRSAPLGLNSARAVSRVAGVSPATAASALNRLRGRGLVLRERRMVAEGAARERVLWAANVCHPDWPGLAARLGEAVFSQRARPARASTDDRRVPDRLAHVFWNEDLRTLDPERHGALIANRVLQAKDSQALAWAAGRLSSSDWERAARARTVDPRDAALARTLSRAAAEHR